MKFNPVYYIVNVFIGILKVKRVQKSLFLFTILVISSVSLFAQKQKPKNISWYDDKPLHFGFSIGLNTMDFNITPSLANMQVDSLYPEVSILNPGINIQIVSNLHPSDYFDIRFLPGVSFGQRNVRFYKNQVLENDNQRLESSFLEFPLLVKFKGARLNNVRPYVVAGLNYRYDLAGKKAYENDPNKPPEYLRLNRSDLYYEVGPGLDFYLPYFKLSVELKVSTGMRDVLVHDYSSSDSRYVKSIEKMKSQIWLISFHFE